MASISFNDRFKNKSKQLGKQGIINIESSNAVLKEIIPESKLHKISQYMNKQLSLRENPLRTKLSSDNILTERGMKIQKSMKFIIKNYESETHSYRSPLFIPPLTTQKSFARIQLDSLESAKKSPQHSSKNKIIIKGKSYDDIFFLNKVKSKLLPINLKSNILRTLQDQQNLKK